MTTNHTPGPWETSVLSDGTQWQVCEEGAGDWIADCKNADDALLIAAAPELLAALEWACAGVEYMETEYSEQLTAARAAIARAKGQA